MSTGLINLVTVGSATITVTHPPTGLTTTVPVTVTSAVVDHLDLLTSSTSGQIGNAAPTLTTQVWADAAETTPSTATVMLGYTSSNAGVATVNATSGVVTLVAAGTVAFTVRDSISGKSATSATVTVSGSGTVSGVTVSYNGQAAPVLARTGITYQLVAKDQNGNTLSGGTWSSSDITNAPISPTGLAAPANGASGKGVTWTYTHTDGNGGTLKATVLKSAPAIKSDFGPNYSSDANLLANVRTNVSSNSAWNTGTATGGSGALYGDGQYANEIQIDSTRLFMGNRTFRVSLPSGGPVPILRASLGANYQRLVGYYVRRYEPGFTMVGQPVGGHTDAYAYKITPWYTWPGQGDGRGGPEGTNGNSNSGTGGAPGGTFDLGVGGGGSGQSTQTTYVIQGEFSASNPQYYLDILTYEARSGNIISMRHYHCPIGSDVAVLNGAGNSLPYGIVEGPMVAGVAPFQPNTWSPFGENFNNAPALLMWHNDYCWEVVDATTTGDPLGIFGTQPTPTLTGITGGTIAHGATNQTVTLTGTNFTEYCYPVFSNPGILVQSISTSFTSTSLSCVVNVTSGATPGSSTVLMKNSASMVNTGAQPITVT